MRLGEMYEGAQRNIPKGALFGLGAMSCTRKRDFIGSKTETGFEGRIGLPRLDFPDQLSDPIHIPDFSGIFFGSQGAAEH